MHINLQLRCMSLIGDINHLFPSGGHVVAAQLQQAGIIRDRLHAAIFMGQRHADAACVQRTIRRICGRAYFAGNICNRRIAVSLPIKILAAAHSCRGSPCLILIWIKRTYIEISKSVAGICSRSIPSKSNTSDIHLIGVGFWKHFRWKFFYTLTKGDINTVRKYTYINKGGIGYIFYCICVIINFL